MRYVVLLLRIYVWLMFGWAIMTWIPGLAGSKFHNLIGIPVIPLVKLFSFLSIGQIGFGLMFAALLINMLASWLEKNYVVDDFSRRADVPDPSPQDERRGGGDY